MVKAAEQAKEMGLKELNVHTDSQFLINCKCNLFFSVKISVSTYTRNNEYKLLNDKELINIFGDKEKISFNLDFF